LNDRLKASITEAWDRGVGDYDELVAHGRLTRTEADAWKEVLARHLPPPPARVLEIGAGTGVMSLLIAELGYELTATDISHAMLQRARAKAADRGLSGVQFEIADAEVLPFQEGEFDAVFGRHILWTLPDPQRAVTEWRRVLRASGVLVIVDSLSLRRGLRLRMQRAISNLMLRLRPPAGGHRYGPGVHEALPLLGNSDPNRYSELISAAGFGRVQVETLDRLKRLELKAMPLVERWHAQDRKYLFAATRD
jgi:ubiquinone/menaquinone biosynthesis C-methylase UbiE